MAKLYFYYSAMNAGKTTTLLQSSHNYAERGMTTLLLKPLIDDREGMNVIRSRVGLEAEAKNFEKEDNLLQTIEAQQLTKSLNCVLVDEAQFLTKKQVHGLGKIADELNIPVMTYGIRTDFRGELFEGSQELLALADNLKELKTICSECDKKATMVVRLDSNGKILLEGEKILIGGNEIYKTLCRKHFRELTKLI